MNMRMQINRFFVFAVLLFSIQTFADNLNKVDYLPVQDGGRIKPFDTFARETLQLVYGKKSYKGRSASEVVFTWLLLPEQWSRVPMFEVRHSGLREALKLEHETVYFTMEQLLRNERIPILFQELKNMRERQEKLNPYFQEVQRLENQLTLVHAIQVGQAVRVAPAAQSDTWVAVAQLEEPLQSAFMDVVRSFVSTLDTHEPKPTLPVDSATPALPLAQSLANFMERSQEIKPNGYVSLQKISVEVWYNRIHPFQWAWVAYLLSAVCLIFFLVAQKFWQQRSAWIFLGLGFLLHTLGIAIRVYLSGRPPVSNMYETVVWVPWGTIVFGVILQKYLRTNVILLCAALIAVFCLILTDLSPTVLDASIQPLEPVLRSTFWLTTHVLIIVISYAAFFLAFGLGDLILFYCLRDEQKYAKQIKDGAVAIYRAIQIGVVLLAAGIILGGVWADYSWGRFWGWDPKETWALIALLGYVALLHGRLAGWVRDYGIAAGSIVAFSLVIMAWYGVNFVLGAGLHSYGFGAGGVEYVSAFVVAHLLFVVYVTTVRYSRRRNVSAQN